MDPITAAIVSALGVIGGKVLEGAGEAAKQAVTDGYNGLKALLRRKFGESSEIATAVQGIENNPASSGRATVLHEELEKVGADKDQELLKAAQELQQKIEAQPGGRQYVQTVIGNLNAVVQGGGSATVYNYGDRPPSTDRP